MLDKTTLMFTFVAGLLSGYGICTLILACAVYLSSNDPDDKISDYCTFRLAIVIFAILALYVGYMYVGVQNGKI
jgi:hypothetical protein